MDADESLIKRQGSQLLLVVLLLVLGVGAALRLVPSSGFKGLGADERFYEIFVNSVKQDGVLSYPQIFADYVEHQTKPASPLVLPPGRMAYILSAWLCGKLTGMEAMAALRLVSALAGVALLGVAAAFVWRARGPEWAIGVTALLACSPLQIHLAQRAWIDGFFAFWAMMVLWTLWECLRYPLKRRWLLLYGASIVVMVLTKENAAFVMAGVGVLLLANLRMRFGVASRSLWIVTAAAPLVAALLLAIAAGGLETLVAAYRLNLAKSVVSPYALEMGDGPWFRYLVDLVLLSPAVFVVALIGMGRLRKPDILGGYLLIFVGTTFVIMGQLRYGMNARYANIWELGLSYFAVAGVVGMVELIPTAGRRVAMIAAIVLLCVSGLWQYDRYFMTGGIYDPLPGAMERAVKILKK